MEKTFEYKTAKISYTRQGTGPVICLVHGFGEDRSVFDCQVNALKDKYCLLVTDLPGSGVSELWEDNEATMENFAACLYALLQHEQVSHCIMLGHSMGGYITLAFAAHYPEALLGFGLVHSTAFADSIEKIETRRKAIGVIKEYGAYSFLKNTMPNLFSAGFKQQQPAIVESLVEKGSSFSVEALTLYYEAMMKRPDRTEVLKNAQQPVLFILGTEDTAAPLNDLLQQVHLPKVSQVNILSGIGHMGMLEAPDVVTGFIDAFASLVQHHLKK